MGELVNCQGHGFDWACGILCVKNQVKVGGLSVQRWIFGEETFSCTIAPPQSPPPPETTPLKAPKPPHF